MNRATNEGVITQEEFEWAAMEACALTDRLVAVENEFKGYARLANKEIIVADVEAAFRVVELTEEASGLREDMQRIALRLEALNMPKSIWIRYARADMPSARVKLFNTPGAPAIKVEFGG